MDIDFMDKLTLKIPSGFSDGVTLYRELPVSALMRESYTLSGSYGDIDDGTVLLLKSSETPYPGCIVVDSAGTERELRSVKVCRSLDGLLIAYRCTV